MNERVLVIKHGALGDMVQALGAFQAIRNHHSDAHITLLTTAPFVSIMECSPFFNEVWLDQKRHFLSISSIARFRKRFFRGEYSIVYDLQNSDRTGWYYRLLWPYQPLWSGYVWGCSHPHRTKHRPQLHTLDRIAEQLALAGISYVPSPSLDWLPDTAIALPRQPYALMLVGGAPHRPEKRWPVKQWQEFLSFVLQKGITPVLLGTKAEREAIESLLQVHPEAFDLCEKTSLADIVTLARQAVFAVGNDTGPMHMAAVAGCPSLVLYSNASNPKRCGQRGRKVIIEQVNDLQHLEASRVISIVQQEFLSL
jgi:ADP-heptose:LPS heptosyltransferase